MRIIDQLSFWREIAGERVSVQFSCKLVHCKI